MISQKRYSRLQPWIRNFISESLLDDLIDAYNLCNEGERGLALTIIPLLTHKFQYPMAIYVEVLSLIQKYNNVTRL